MAGSSVALLMLVYALSYLDRQIVSILAEPIKNDLKLSDKQLGLLVGLSFAIFYTGFGLPLARLAERMNRSILIASCLLIWSLFTAICGFAGSFAMLLLMRVGVAIGEAGCLPPSQALIADYVPTNRKASAMALLIAGSPLGILAGMALGGIAAAQLGWRPAFVIAALPGVPLAIILLFKVRDPMRKTLMGTTPATSFGSSLGALIRDLRFVLMVSAAGLAALVSYALAGFLASFLLRVHHDDVTALGGSLGASGFVGLALGLILGVGGLIGTLGGGRIADRLALGVRGQMLVSAVSLSMLAPCLFGALVSPGLGLTLTLLVPCAVLNAGWAGPFYAALVSEVAPTSRATASALALLIVNLIGLGAGPILVGTLSDHFAVTYGSADGLRWALVATLPICLLSAALFWTASRTSVAIDH